MFACNSKTCYRSQARLKEDGRESDLYSTPVKQKNVHRIKDKPRNKRRIYKYGNVSYECTREKYGMLPGPQFALSNALIKIYSIRMEKVTHIYANSNFNLEQQGFRKETFCVDAIYITTNQY